MPAKTIRLRPQTDVLDEIEKAVAAVRKAQALLERAGVHVHRVCEELRYGQPPGTDVALMRAETAREHVAATAHAASSTIYQLHQLLHLGGG